MKKFLKNNFPRLFSILKSIYQKTTYYKNEINRQKEFQKINQEKKEKQELRIINDVFNNEYIVHNGPFKGMKYIGQSSGSALLPKILGSYEEPIHAWIEEVIEERRYKHILDIGCAEWYYACGFAMRMPNVKIVAYDIDEYARKNATKLKELNNIKNIEIKEECTHEELNIQSQKDTLVFCDIEGYEEILLDPLKVSNLKNVDLLIESHDCFIPNITEELIKRFYLTHKIRIVVDYPYRIKKYTTPNPASKDILRYITDEKRVLYMKFIYMERINHAY